MSIVDELVTILGFEVDDGDAKRFSVTLDKVKRGAFAVGAAVGAAAAAVGVFTKSMAEDLDETGKFSDSIGVNAKKLQALEFAINRAGGSSGELRGDLASLTKQLASPIPGEFNQALQFVFGINPFDAMTGGLKEADAVLLEVADKLEGLSPQKAQIMASQLGLSEGTLRMLVMGREEITRLGAEARSLGAVIPKEDMVNAALLTDQLYNTTAAIRGIAQTVAASLFPAFTEANTVLNDFIKANRELIATGISSVMRGVTDGVNNFIAIVRKGVEIVTKFIPKMDGLTNSFDAFEAISGAVTGALIVAAAAFAPIIIKVALIGAAITGAAIAIQDLIKWFNGADSVSGTFVNNFLQKFPEVAKLLDSVKSLIVSIGGVFKSMYTAVSPLIDALSTSIGKLFSSKFGEGFLDIPMKAIAGFTELLGIATKYMDLLAALFTGDGSNILGAIKALADKIKDTLGKLLPDWITNIFTSDETQDDSATTPARQETQGLEVASEEERGFFASLFDAVRNISPAIISEVAASGPAGIANSVVNNSAQSRVGDTTVHITVPGSGNPVQTAKTIQSILQTPMARTMQTGSAGVIR